MPKDLTGQTFGSFKLVALLGRGGMASVYRAYQESIDRWVAVKVLPQEFLHDPSFAARFISEARTLAKLTHTSILPLYDFGTAHDLPYIVMPLMSNGTLADRLKGGPLSLADVVRILTPIADALDFAHSQGILHRDIKPSNILFDQRDTPFLGDFGIAKALEATSGLTGTGIIGTPDYMSPEQARGEVLDGRSDIYSLGVMVFQMLTGAQLFHATTPIGIMLKHATEPPPPLRQSRPDLPQAAEAVLEKALAKYPRDRFQTAGAFMKALADPTGAQADAVGETVIEPLPTVRGDQPQPPGASRPAAAPPTAAGAPAPTLPEAAPVPAGKGGIGRLMIGGGLGMVAGVVVAALLVCAAGALCVVALGGFGASTPTPPPTATPTPDPYLLSDDFSDPGSGWEVSSSPEASVGYADGQYVIHTVQTGWFVWGNPFDKMFSNVHIEVTVRNVSQHPDTAFGIMCGFQDNQHYYYMGIDIQGYYAIARWDGGQGVILTNDNQWVQSTGIARGGGSYRLGADCGNGTLALYVDGVFIDSANDSTYGPGNIGLFADVFAPASGDAHQPTDSEIRFDNLTVTALP